MIVSRAPVRLSMGGGGTDLPSYYRRHGGFLMAAAIDRYVHVAANRRFNREIRLAYSKTEIVSSVDEIEHPIFREGLRLTGVTEQIELASVADIPANCGLGTSSTFTVAMLNALYSYRREYLSLRDLAEAACGIEIGRAGRPIGKQDQYAAAYGGFNAYTFATDGTVTVEKVAIKDEHLRDLQNNMVMFWLGIERSAAEVLSVQDKASREGDEATIARLGRIKDIGLHTRRLFEEGRIDEFGEVMHEHWETKRRLSSAVSNPAIDEAYETARRNGALGGKVVGAGGGGFLLVYCPGSKQGLVAAMEKLGLQPTWVRFEFEGAKVVYQH
ncbi:MAG: sugar kinase [Deltaproteobacteria bacterium]|nr:sugar kinase [Deltaproteobacteria bacterium]